MQKSIDGAAGDLRVECRFGRASCDDELKIRKLILETLGQLRDRADGCSGVNDDDARAVADEMRRKICFRTDDEELAFGNAGGAHGCTQRQVVCEHNEAFTYTRT